MSDKFILRTIIAISVFVLLVVIVLKSKIIPAPAQVPGFAWHLPALNAIINGTCSVLLLVSLYYIKKKDVKTHKRINMVTFLLSALFLVSYIVFHYLAPQTFYGDVDRDGIVSAEEKLEAGGLRYVYYVILVTHIVLAAAVLPLILLSFHRGLQMQVERHRKLVRWSFPVWLYVTVTGVIVYLMISPFYPY